MGILWVLLVRRTISLALDLRIMARKRKGGPPKGVMPKNYAQFREAGKATHFAKGFKGQSVRQIEDTKHLIDWLSEYDKPQEVTKDIGKISESSPGEFQPSYCPLAIEKNTLTGKTHKERVQEMLDKLKPESSRMINNDPASLVNNFKLNA